MLVERAEPLDLGGFLAISADDSRAGQIFLGVRRQRREMLLYGLEPVVNRLSHFYGEDRQENRRQERQERQLHVDPQHEVQREQAAEDGVGEVHHRRAEGHPHSAEVIGKARHDIAGAGLCKICRVERLQMCEEIVAQVVLHPAADAIHQLAHAVSECAADYRGKHDEPGKFPDRGHRRSGADRIDRASQQPGDDAGDCRRREDYEQTDCKWNPVRFVVWRSAAKVGHIP